MKSIVGLLSALGALAVLRVTGADVTTQYQVDPTWPRKPADVTWGAMSGISVNDKDEIWLFTRGTPPVQVYDRDGKYLRGWGADFVGKAHQIRFDRDGNVWLVDVGNHVVLKCAPDGKVLKTLGVKGEAGDDAAHFNKPTDIAITPDGELFITDGYGNSRVVHFDREGRFVNAWGKPGTGPGEFDLPHSICMDSQGRLYVADRSNFRVQVFDRSGKFLAEWRDRMVPWSLCITRNGEIWACGSSPMPRVKDKLAFGLPPKDQVLIKFNTAGKPLQTLTFPKGEEGREKPGELNWFHAVAEDSQGSLYVGDIMGQRAQKFVRKKPL
ncbi:MAG: peptidyl-alpha-hydroxyglycine alpha-amidating lyase family protein [Verrucomicrobiae bacterium]|nr:peptidyl-alpha-hydroxyglycine alpha-amidating lyase family protein [Verrucomicrobiae bacterium]